MADTKTLIEAIETNNKLVAEQLNKKLTTADVTGSYADCTLKIEVTNRPKAGQAQPKSTVVSHIFGTAADATVETKDDITTGTDKNLTTVKQVKDYTTIKDVSVNDTKLTPDADKNVNVKINENTLVLTEDLICYSDFLGLRGQKIASKGDSLLTVLQAIFGTKPAHDDDQFSTSSDLTIPSTWNPCDVHGEAVVSLGAEGYIWMKCASGATNLKIQQRISEQGNDWEVIDSEQVGNGIYRTEKLAPGTFHLRLVE